MFLYETVLVNTIICLIRKSLKNKFLLRTRGIYSLTLKTTNKDKADLPITNVINSFRVYFRLIYFINYTKAKSSTCCIVFT